MTVGSTTSVSVSTNNTGASYAWGTSNAAVATVNNGTITGVSAGKAIIKATAGGYEADCVVSVSAGA